MIVILYVNDLMIVISFIASGTVFCEPFSPNLVSNFSRPVSEGSEENKETFEIFVKHYLP